MNPTVIKTVAFLLGSTLVAAATLPQLAPYAAFCTGIGGTLVGWSGLKRPGDASVSAVDAIKEDHPAAFAALKVRK